MYRTQGLMNEASTLVFKETSTGKLRAHLFSPPGCRGKDRRTAVVFFSAGLWNNVVISQFAPNCLHFRQRGALSVIFEYRELSKQGMTPVEAIADARSALRWLRLNHDTLGIDPERIVASGASGGGHLCLCAAMLDGYDEPGNPEDVSCVPDALALFSPVVDTTKKGVGFEAFRDPKEAKLTSPNQNVRKGLPPSVIFQGLDDRVVSPDSVIRFVKSMRRKKNLCQVYTYPGAGHSFFNFNVSMPNFESTLNVMDRFLVDLGFLPENELDDGTNRLAS